MQALVATLLLSLLGTSFAAPAATKSGQPAPQPTEPTIVTFKLVHTTDSSPDSVQPALTNGNAIELFDPLHQSDYLLRIGKVDNVDQLPTFSLSKGSLHVQTKDITGYKNIELVSNKLCAGDPVTLSQKPNGSSGITWNGPLLTVGEIAGDFQLCDGPLGQKVIYYKGTHKSCQKLGFLQASPVSEVL